MAKKNIYYLFHKEGGREITNSGELKLINQSQDLCERLNDADYDTVTKMCCDAHNSGLSKGINIGIAISIAAMGVGGVLAILDEYGKNKKKRDKDLDEIKKKLDKEFEELNKTKE